MKNIEIYPRDFEGVWIPKEIYLNKNLNALDKIIYAEINSLDNHLNGGDYCFASNQYLADFCGCSVRKVSDQINKLISMGYLRVVKTDGRKRWIESCLKTSIANFAMQTSKNNKSNERLAENSVRVANSASQNGEYCYSEKKKLPESIIDDKYKYKNNNNIDNNGDSDEIISREKYYAIIGNRMEEVDKIELPFD